MFLDIDGSYGEGGGAIVRVSTALSVLTGKPLHLFNIRAGRPRPGLMAQHLNAVKILAKLSQAKTESVELNSSEIFFEPHTLRGGDFQVRVGTAGSLTLILQAFLIPACFAESPLNITLVGGTDVRWAPPFEYLVNVNLKALELMGYSLKLDLQRRGHYPRGGGQISAHIDPPRKLKPIKLDKLIVKKIKGVSHATCLPQHVAERQAQAAEKILHKEGYDADIRVEFSDNALGSGSGIVLWTEGTNGHPSRVGGSALGERGKRAEIVGSQAAQEILGHIKSYAPVDKYLADQLIPYIALAGSSRIRTSQMTMHTRTNIYLAEKLTGRTFQVEEDDQGIFSISTV